MLSLNQKKLEIYNLRVNAAELNGYENICLLINMFD